MSLVPFWNSSLSSAALFWVVFYRPTQKTRNGDSRQWNLLSFLYLGHCVSFYFQKKRKKEKEKLKETAQKYCPTRQRNITFEALTLNGQMAKNLNRKFYWWGFGEALMTDISWISGMLWVWSSCGWKMMTFILQRHQAGGTIARYLRSGRKLWTTLATFI